MPKSATDLARKLPKRDEVGLETLRVHMFELDGDEDDDELDENLHAEFSADFDRVQAELTTAFGAALPTIHGLPPGFIAGWTASSAAEHCWTSQQWHPMS